MSSVTAAAEMSELCVLDTDTSPALQHSEVTWDDDGEALDVELWDTAGQEALPLLRAVIYPETDVFLVAYDMMCVSSLENVEDWLDEIEEYADDYGLILVGTKYDLWLEKKEDGDDEVCTEEAIAEVTDVSTCHADG